MIKNRKDCSIKFNHSTHLGFKAYHGKVHIEILTCGCDERKFMAFAVLMKTKKLVATNCWVIHQNYWNNFMFWFFPFRSFCWLPRNRWTWNQQRKQCIDIWLNYFVSKTVLDKFCSPTAFNSCFSSNGILLDDFIPLSSLVIFQLCAFSHSSLSFPRWRGKFFLCDKNDGTNSFYNFAN